MGANGKERYRRDDEVAHALWQSNGEVAPAAKQLGISVQAVYQRVISKPHLRPHPIKKVVLRPDTYISDEKCKELIAVIPGARVERYVWYRETLSTKPAKERGSRYQQMAEAVAGTLGISPSEAFAALAAAKPLLREKKRQEQLLNKLRNEIALKYLMGDHSG